MSTTSRFAVAAWTLASSLLAVTCAVVGCGDKQEEGEYDQGPYHCCAPNRGTSCCSGYRQGLCFAYGGPFGDCLGPGEQYDAKISCAKCCDGLQRADLRLVPS